MTQLDSPPKLGRRRDPSRDNDILEATLDVLAETGYDGLTIDMIASRAKAGKATVYRRWDSKAELVIDAVACMKGRVDLDNIPDTGSLRGDLVAQIKTPTLQDAERKLKVVTGMASLITRNPELADAVYAAVLEPRLAVSRIVYRRAIERGEVSPDVDIEMLAQISPSMVTYRTMMLGKPADRDFLISLIDNIIVPAALKK